MTLQHTGHLNLIIQSCYDEQGHLSQLDFESKIPHRIHVFEQSFSGFLVMDQHGIRYDAIE